MPIAPPPVETAEQLLGTEPQPRELIRPLRRSVAADSVAIDNVDLAVVEAHGVFNIHLPMGKADGPGNVTRGIGIARASIYDDYLGTPGFEIDG